MNQLWSGKKTSVHAVAPKGERSMTNREEEKPAGVTKKAVRRDRLSVGLTAYGAGQG